MLYSRKLIVNRAFFLLLAIVLGACTGGSGSGTESNTNTSSPTTTPAAYSGPAPQTQDVQSFKINLWDNLIAENRCGACHSTAGQAPIFVRADDINLAYNAANGIVDLNIPANSRMVSKVGGGHNCWLDNNSVCADIITNYITAWASTSGSATTVVALTAPAIKEVGTSRAFPDSTTGFVPVHNLLTRYCSSCHTEDAQVRQQPYIASRDIDVAYEAAKSKIDLDTPSQSRLVTRLATEFHNCWDDCSSNAATMESAIAGFSSAIPLSVVDPSLLASKALNLEADGLVASSGGRVENFMVARYEFKAGSGLTAFDTSGVDPAVNLNLIGDVEWLGSWGIRINDGKAQASTADSRKLYDLITATNEYSVEAWVVPDNVAQDGPARIVSYSGGDDRRNFTLGQTLYNYDFLNRSTATDANGQPALSTDDDAERLQATLQHVVLTYNPVDGRRIYVNGEYSGDVDEQGGGTLTDWDDSFALVLGNEVSNDNLWQGSVRLLAIHNRAMSAADVVKNFDAGVGEKFFLLFSVSHLIDLPESFIVFEVEQFDNYGYLFNAPFFTSLDASVSPSGIPLKGVRIGINGQELAVGQAFSKLDTTLNSAEYINTRQTLSTLGSVIPIDKGAQTDEFFLTFDLLGNNSFVRVEALPSGSPIAADIVDQSLLGVRDFSEINQALSGITGVNTATADVATTFEVVKQQLPTVENIDGFLAAHQMGVTQLAVGYCSSLVGELGDLNTAHRDAYFGGFDFSRTPDIAFDSAGRALIVDALVTNLLSHSLPIGLDYPSPVPLQGQPVAGDMASELNRLIDLMLSNCPGSCPSQSDRTLKVIKATCAAAAASAVMLLQ